MKFFNWFNSRTESETSIIIDEMKRRGGFIGNIDFYAYDGRDYTYYNPDEEEWFDGKTCKQNKTACSFTYIEPFLGSGTVFISLLKYMRDTKWFDGYAGAGIKFILNDINENLITAFRTAMKQGPRLIEVLTRLDEIYKQSVKADYADELYNKFLNELNTISNDFKDKSNEEILHYHCRQMLIDYKLCKNVEGYMNENIYLIIAALFVFIADTCEDNIYETQDNKCVSRFGYYNDVDICDDSVVEAINILYQSRCKYRYEFVAMNYEDLGSAYPQYFPTIGQTGAFVKMTNKRSTELMTMYLDPPAIMEEAWAYHTSVDDRFADWIMRVLPSHRYVNKILLTIPAGIVQYRCKNDQCKKQIPVHSIININHDDYRYHLVNAKNCKTAIDGDVYFIEV